jgi:hypothetical protein
LPERVGKAQHHDYDPLASSLKSRIEPSPRIERAKESLHYPPTSRCRGSPDTRFAPEIRLDMMACSIACGDYIMSRIGDSTFVAGKPIIEAYDFEQRQDWVGMMLAPSAIKAAQPLNLPSHCNTTMPNDVGRFPTFRNFSNGKGMFSTTTKYHFMPIPKASRKCTTVARSYRVVRHRWVR